MASLARVASVASLVLLARPIAAQQACPGEPETLDLVRLKQRRPTIAADDAHQDLVVVRVLCSLTCW